VKLTKGNEQRGKAPKVFLSAWLPLVSLFCGRGWGKWNGGWMWGWGQMNQNKTNILRRRNTKFIQRFS